MDEVEWLGQDNTLGVDIWRNKYRKDESETFEEWLLRVSGKDKDVMRLIREKKFLFGGRILANRGLQHEGKKITLSNCYVIESPSDNLESIYNTAAKMARTFSYGGGVGTCLGNLAPSGAKVNNAAKTTSGAISFGDIFDVTTGLIGSEGRRAALMLTMPVTHPDIENFISVKSDLNKLNKANLSIKFTDEFLEAVNSNSEFELYFKRETGEEIKKTINAKELFNKFVKNNYDFGEPGCIFWDRATHWSMICDDPDYKLESSNPCGEQILPAYGACCLGSINVSQYIVPSSNGYYFDSYDFMCDVTIITRAMNDVLDEGILLHPLKEQQETASKYRQIGIGCFGFHDALIKLKMKYGSQESLAFADEVAESMLNAAVIESARLAKKYGTYPEYNKETVLSSKFFKENLCDVSKELVEKYGLRNATLLSIAPTGTLSTMEQCSGGIEPYFAISYNRRTESLHNKSVTYKVYTPIIKELMDELNITDEKDLPDYIITSQEIDPMDRIKMQATWQKYVDASISSTINLSESATEEDIFNIYMSAWKQGLKGVTIFRDNCARLGILTTDKPNEKIGTNSITGKDSKIEYSAKGTTQSGSSLNTTGRETVVWPVTYVPDYNPNMVYPYTTSASDTNALKRGVWKQIADDTVFHKIKLTTACGTLNLFIGFSESENNIQEIWVKSKGSGGCRKSIDAITILMSAVLRLGGSLENVKKAFRGIGACNAFVKARTNGKGLSTGTSCADAIFKAVEHFYETHVVGQNIYSSVESNSITQNFPISIPLQIYKNFTAQSVSSINSSIITRPCPDCGEQLIASGGCISCPACGYSKCN